MNDAEPDTRQGAKRTSEKLHPNTIQQDCSSPMNQGAYTSDVNHYDRCNLIMEDILREIGGIQGCAHGHLEINERLREFAMKLENWKNSIRWSATGGQSTGSLADDESKARCLLSELKQHNHELFQTIHGFFDDFSRSFTNVTDVLTNDTASDSCLSDVLKELETSGRSLAKQLRPIGTYAREVYRPRQLHDAQTSLTSVERDSTTARSEGSEDVPRKRSRLESHASESPYTSMPAKDSIMQVESTFPPENMYQPLPKFTVPKKDSINKAKLSTPPRKVKSPLPRLAKRAFESSYTGTPAKDGIMQVESTLPPENMYRLLSNFTGPKNEGIDEAKATSPPPKVETSLPKLTRYQRIQPTAVKRKENQGIRNPAGSAKSTKAKPSWLNVMEKIKDLYQYQKIEDHQVRLLIIKAGQDDDDVNAILQVVEDDKLGTDDYYYEALSYHWGEGEGEELHGIFINDEWSTEPIRDFTAAVQSAVKVSHAKRLYVRPNLHSTLKRLRAQDRSVALWVDALCINQHDDTEKTTQIMKMNRIYRNAYNVFVWLGMDDANFHSSKAMAFIKEVVDLSKLNDLLTQDKFIPQWASLFQLLQWSWFSRRWVIQEVALAQEATVHCGQSQVHWNDFRDAIGIFCRYFELLQPRIRDPKLGGSPKSDLEPLGAKLLVEITSNLFRTKSDGSSESTMGLEELVCQLSTFSTSDPRDTINSLRNLSKELDVVKTRSSSAPARTHRQPPEPNYKQDLFEVYRDFVEWVVEESESLNIICRHWALKEKEKLDIGPTTAPRLVTLPSWILTTEAGSYGAGEAVFRGRKAGDSLVGLPGQAVYNASGRSIPIVQFGDGNAREWSPSPASGSQLPIFPHDMSLTVSGHIIGRVSWSSPPIRSGLIPQQGLEKLGWTFRHAAENKPAPDQLRRTLVAGRGPNGSDIPTYYSRACSYCLFKKTPNGDIDTTDLLRADESVSPPALVKDYLERVLAVTSNRVILQGRSTTGSPPSHSVPTSPTSPTSPRTSEDLVGLGPFDTKEHDVIAILYGCSVPVILRRSGSYNRPQEYRFLGEAYIYGKMDAECMSEGYEEMEFVLR